MATTSSTTGNFSTSRYSEMIQKQLLEVTPNEYVFRSATEESSLKGVSGHSNQLRINRNRRIAIPVTTATEGTAPTATTLEIDSTTGTADQYVMSVKFTDVMEIYAFHDVLSQAVGAVKDAMVRLDEMVCGNAFVAATNIIYPGTVTARSGLAATNVVDSDVCAKAFAALNRGSNIYGPAKPYEGGLFLGLIHGYAIQDLQKDATFLAAETRAQNSKLFEQGIVADWKGIRWKRTNWMPEYQNMSTGMASLTLVDATAVTDSTATASLNGFKLTQVATGGTFLSGTTYNWSVVARHKLRGFAENISGILILATGGAGDNESYTCVAPTSTDYWYDVYQGTSGGTRYRTLTNVEGASSNTITTPLTSGTAAPVAPAVSVTVTPIFVCGMGAVKSSDLRGLESFITPRVSTPDDPAIQNRTVSAKVFEGAFIQQNAWIRKIEVATAFA